jgi:hypothetical protein
MTPCVGCRFATETAGEWSHTSGEDHYVDLQWDEVSAGRATSTFQQTDVTVRWWMWDDGSSGSTREIPMGASSQIEPISLMPCYPSYQSGNHASV